jgi:hypothetical protein
MTSASKVQQIDQLMEKASAALAKTKYFEAERLADKALRLARRGDDFARMTRIIMPLQEARRQRLLQALDVGTVTIINESVSETTRVDPGCYLVRPPQVGADARRLRLAGLQQEVPTAVVCREPLTQLKLCPIVAIAPGVTVREMVDPPEDPEEIDMAWFVGAMEAIGDRSIMELDPALATLKRVDALMGRLDAMPEHEGLHHALAEACQDAEREQKAENGAGSTRSKRAKKTGR